MSESESDYAIKDTTWHTHYTRYTTSNGNKEKKGHPEKYHIR